MSKTMSTLLTLALTLCLLIAFAQEDDGFVEEDAHEHGAAVLNVAQEQDSLTLEFISPSVNIVGFEYQPSDDAEQVLVDEAVAALADGATLFSPSEAAECTLLNAEVEGLTDQEHEEEHGEDEEHEAEDAEDEEHEGEEAEGEEAEDANAEEEHEGEEGETHSEFHAMYEFSCANPESLSGLELSELFALYPGIEDLDVNYALDSSQGAAELNAESTQATF